MHNVCNNWRSMGFLRNSFLLLFLLSMIGVLSCSVFCRSIHVHDGQLQHLEGSRIGETVRGLHKLKRYLSRFGYLDHAHVAAAGAGEEEDHFEDRLESALKLFQKTYNLNVSGVVDSATLNLVATPRCGVPDFINGSVPAIGTQWVHFPGDQKWNKRTLSWSWLQPTRPYPFAQASLDEAISKWARATGLTFEGYTEVHEADITVGFYRRYHGDLLPFDGPRNVLGHASPPGTPLVPSSYVHLDADEAWSDVQSGDKVDLTSVMLHELGHTLGLMHSADKNAVMYAYLYYGELKRVLTQDDIDGIKALYS